MAETILIGGMVGTRRYDISGGLIVVAKFTASATGTMNEFKLDVNGNCNAKIGVYADSAGSPGALLASNQSGQACVNGQNTLTFPSLSITSGTDYWLGVNIDAALGATISTGSGTSQYQVIAYANAWPDPWGSGTNLGEILLYEGDNLSAATVRRKIMKHH